MFAWYRWHRKYMDRQRPLGPAAMKATPCARYKTLRTEKARSGLMVLEALVGPECQYYDKRRRTASTLPI